MKKFEIMICGIHCFIKKQITKIDVIPWNPFNLNYVLHIIY